MNQPDKNEHDWMELADLNFVQGNERRRILSCKTCGMVKTGPWAEPGAYHFYQYTFLGKSEDRRKDPPCAANLQASPGLVSREEVTQLLKPIFDQIYDRLTPHELNLIRDAFEVRELRIRNVILENEISPKVCSFCNQDSKTMRARKAAICRDCASLATDFLKQEAEIMDSKCPTVGQ